MGSEMCIRDRPVAKKPRPMRIAHTSRTTVRLARLNFVSRVTRSAYVACEVPLDRCVGNCFAGPFRRHASVGTRHLGVVKGPQVRSGPGRRAADVLAHFADPEHRAGRRGQSTAGSSTCTAPPSGPQPHKTTSPAVCWKPADLDPNDTLGLG